MVRMEREVGGTKPSFRKFSRTSPKARERQRLRLEEEEEEEGVRGRWEEREGRGWQIMLPKSLVT